MAKLRWYGPQRMNEINGKAKANVATAGILLKKDIQAHFQETPVMVGKRGAPLRTGPGLPHRRVPSKPGEPPAVQTGILKGSIIAVTDVDREGPVSRVGPMAMSKGKSVKYARFLEFGFGMKARPFMRPAVDRMKHTIARVLART